MRSSSLFTFFTLVLATSARPELSQEGLEKLPLNKQVIRGKVSVEEVSMTFTQATQSVVTSSHNGNIVTLKQDVASVQVCASQLTTVVETLDGSEVIIHQTTVVEVFASFISMINAISELKDGAQICHTELININAAFRQITSTYLTKGIDLRVELQKNQDGPQFDETKFDALGLQSPFADDSNVQPFDDKSDIQTDNDSNDQSRNSSQE